MSNQVKSNHADVQQFAFSPPQVRDPGGFQVELTLRNGEPPTAAISGASDSYHSPEAALAAVLPHARSYAERACSGLWLRICDAREQPVFGTLVP